jgi:hypothetical protein
MSKSKNKRTRTRRRGARERVVDVISQLECATRHPRAAILGGVLGGAVPWFARALAHDELPEAWSTGHRWLAGIMLVVVLGCCAFSMLTVYKFGKAAFDDAHKAAGFVAAMEGVMLVSHGTTSIVALALLVVINAIANGCVIALAREATERRREADTRRSATRARNRAQGNGEAPAASAPATIPVSRSRVRQPPQTSPVPPASRVNRPGLAIVTRPRQLPDISDAEFRSEEQLFS